MQHHQLLARLAETTGGRIVLLVLDGVGDLVTGEQPATALERAATPHLDALAARSALGRLVPVVPGVTPGSGPGHLALFGYDVTGPEGDIGRGVLEALGIDLEVRPGDVAARGNFASADRDGRLTDRRAGRIPTAECRRLCGKLRDHLATHPVPELEVTVAAGEGYRFVVLLRGQGLSPALADTDPQRLGVPPLDPEPLPEAADKTAAGATAGKVGQLIAALHRAIADEPRANRVLLRGFSTLPHLPSMGELYHLRCGAFAGYPLYRGVARACGMETVPCGKSFGEILERVRERWEDFDFLFLHVKQADAAGEDGSLDAKVEVIEEVDRRLPELLELGPEVLAVTGDHSTPAPMRSHSWHPVPLLVSSDRCFLDPCRRFTEVEAIGGHLGTFPSRHLMGLLLANAGRLAKFGA